MATRSGREPQADETLRAVRVLLVEDDPDDRSIATRALTGSGGPADADVAVEEATSLATIDGVEHHPDVIVLDLNLPDSVGKATFDAISTRFPSVPIVVLSAVDADGLVSEGAEDVLPKEHMTAPVLGRVVRHAAERANLRQRLQEARQQTELQLLSEIAPIPGTTRSARLFGAGELDEALPEVGARLRAEFANVVEQRIEERLYGNDQGATSRLRAMAEQLGFLHAGPRDVVQLYVDAMRSHSATLVFDRKRVFADEGRLALLELLGLLLAYYRRHALVFRRHDTTPG